MFLQFIIFIFALSALYFGADITIKSAEKIGIYFGLSPLVIGVVIVGFGTSLPEFFVSQFAGFRGDNALSLGNIIGSNIFNMFLILGLCAILTPLNVESGEFKVQLKFHYAVTILFGLILTQDRLNLWLGLTFLSFFAFFLFKTHQVMETIDSNLGKKKISLWEFPKLIIGFGLLWLGGDYLVLSTSKIALSLGISTYFISLIAVATGTSLPELVTSLMIYFRKKDLNMILGNILGSNVFNAAFIGGTVGIWNFPLQPKFWLELVVLIFGTFILQYHAVKKIKFSKVGGLIFLLIYAGMLVYWTLVFKNPTL